MAQAKRRLNELPFNKPEQSFIQQRHNFLRFSEILKIAFVCPFLSLKNPLGISGLMT